MAAERCPCLCGCTCHIGSVCPSCGCSVYSPDYLAGARARGEVIDAETEAVLKSMSAQTSKIFGYLGRPGQGRTAVDGRPKVRCRYCRGRFRGRTDAATCSAACRKAMSVALAYEEDADVPVASIRRCTHSPERALATGFGMVTASEGYRNDLRVRRYARMWLNRARTPDQVTSTSSSV